jgi:hypothetical protein
MERDQVSVEMTLRSRKGLPWQVFRPSVLEGVQGLSVDGERISDGRELPSQGRLCHDVALDLQNQATEFSAVERFSHLTRSLSKPIGLRRPELHISSVARFLVCRAAASKGPADLVAWDTTAIRFVSVKSGTATWTDVLFVYDWYARAAACAT